MPESAIQCREVRAGGPRARPTHEVIQRNPDGVAISLIGGCDKRRGGEAGWRPPARGRDRCPGRLGDGGGDGRAVEEPEERTMIKEIISIVETTPQIKA